MHDPSVKGMNYMVFGGRCAYLVNGNEVGLREMMKMCLRAWDACLDLKILGRVELQEGEWRGSRVWRRWETESEVR